MKKLLPYIAGIAVVVLLLWLASTTKNKKLVFDDRLSFRRRDKAPYGLYVAFQSLSQVFPNAHITVNRKAPADWDSLSSSTEKQTLIIIVPSFRADEFEMKKLINFVKNGNTVFISAAMVSYEVQNMLHSEIPEVFNLNENLALNNNGDSFSVSLATPPFSAQDEYGCPGRRLESYFSKFDSAVSSVLGNGIYILPDFLRFRAGGGNLFFHLTPLAFSNYFLLYGNNINYYNKALSLIPKNTNTVVWDEYFLYKRFANHSDAEKSSFLSALMSQRSFRAAVWLLVTLLCLFVLQEMRRKQRIIPTVASPRNDSLEFVKTIGRLYYEKRDNKNLARKMTAYFLEHVRNRYQLSTHALNSEFVASLKRKTAQPEEDINNIVSFINDIDDKEIISDEELTRFHKELEKFYEFA